MTRPVLSVRNPDVERLLVALPVADADLESTRRFTRSLIAAASAWQVKRAKVRAVGKGERV
jgi:hypothetical protein